LVHTNKIVPEKKRKGEKKTVTKTAVKYFSTPKEKDIGAAYFLQQSDLQ
jgi:hypothetical protein